MDPRTNFKTRCLTDTLDIQTTLRGLPPGGDRRIDIIPAPGTKRPQRLSQFITKLTSEYKYMPDIIENIRPR